MTTQLYTCISSYFCILTVCDYICIYIVHLHLTVCTSKYCMMIVSAWTVCTTWNLLNACLFIHCDRLYLSQWFVQQLPFLGVMNAADYYGLDELKCACSGFIQVKNLIFPHFAGLNIHSCWQRPSAIFCILHWNSIAVSVLHNSGHSLCLVGNDWALFFVYYTVILVLFQCCITVDTVCALLATAERYIQYKCTKFLIQKVLYYCIIVLSLLIFNEIIINENCRRHLFQVLEFVDDHGNEVGRASVLVHLKYELGRR